MTGPHLGHLVSESLIQLLQPDLLLDSGSRILECQEEAGQELGSGSWEHELRSDPVSKMELVPETTGLGKLSPNNVLLVNVILVIPNSSISLNITSESLYILRARQPGYP